MDQEETGKDFARDLANRVCLYQLMTTTPDLEPDPDLEPEPGTLRELPIVEVLTAGNNNILRYGPDHFYRIIINTGVSKYSIAGFAQFQAL